MDIFSIITLGGGLAFFLFGMRIMSSQLEKLAGGKLEKTLKSLTSSTAKSLALGCGITMAIQSSSALTVMLVGFVNSGILQLRQAVGVIMGSNVGTTITAWVLSLAGIKSDGVLLQLLKPSSFSPIIALVGIIMIMTAKTAKRKDIGEVMLGFAILMYGMQLMSSAVSPLAESEGFAGILTMFTNPLLGILFGAIFTMIIQSSSASVGVLQALSTTGSISVGIALPIIMGQNIGTCVTALLSSIGANRSGKRVALVHVLFNIIGTIIVCLIFYPLNAIFRFAFVSAPVDALGIAVMHTIFNLVTTLILAPFPAKFEKLAYRILPEKAETKLPDVYIDERLLLTPAFAIAECRSHTVAMAHLASETFKEAMGLIERFDPAAAERVKANEDLADKYEDRLGTYLVKLSSHELTDHDSMQVSELLHTIGDFERISDHAVNVLHSALEMHDKQITFSEDACAELAVLSGAIREILDISVAAFESDDTALAARVEPLEQVIDELKTKIKENHIRRLQRGKCTIELGFILSDVIGNYERVSDHCSNIAVCIIKILVDSSFDTHAYLSNVKTSGQAAFTHDFEAYKKKYLLPSEE